MLLTVYTSAMGPAQYVRGMYEVALKADTLAACACATYRQTIVSAGWERCTHKEHVHCRLLRQGIAMLLALRTAFMGA